MIPPDHAPPDPTVRVGTVFAEKYRLERLIGVGGMGAVYQGDHVLTGRSFAIKILHPQFAASQELAARFLREAKASAAIAHPAVVEVFDAGRSAEGSLFLVLELLHGSDLRDAIATRRLAPADAVQIAIDVLDVLGAAHARGIVHRDIKPENVFLSVDPSGSRRVKVLDFGIAKQLDRKDLALTRTGAVLGTPYYMSPEQARGAAVDARSDLWSVGATLYHALAGVGPYSGDNYNALIIEIVTGTPPSLAAVRRDLPPKLLAAVDRAMQRELKDRWQNATDFGNALRESLRDFTGVAQLPIGADDEELATSVDTPSGPWANSNPPPDPGSVADPLVDPTMVNDVYLGSAPTTLGQSSPSAAAPNFDPSYGTPGGQPRGMTPMQTFTPMTAPGGAQPAPPARGRGPIAAIAIGLAVVGIAVAAGFGLGRRRDNTQRPATEQRAAPLQSPPAQAPVAPPPVAPAGIVPAPPPVTQPAPAPNPAPAANPTARPVNRPTVGTAPAARTPRVHRVAPLRVPR